MPAFQERDAIAQVIADIRAQAPVEIVVIDDGSGDGTAAEAVHAGARVITLPFNLGIGSAVQTGYMAAQEGDFDVAIQVDGDGQHPAAEITRLVNALAESGADLAIGSRFIGERRYRAPLGRRLGIAVFARVVSLDLRHARSPTRRRASAPATAARSRSSPRPTRTTTPRSRR